MNSSATTPDGGLRRDAQRNRERVLQAAAEVFRERGLDAPFELIAERAEVSLATVYRRFPERDELIETLFRQRLDAMIVIAEQALEQEDPWAGLVSFLERACEMQAPNVALNELLRGGVHGVALTEQVRDRLTPLVDAIARRAQEHGDLRPEIEPADLTVVQIMLWSVIDAVRGLDADVWRRYLAIVLDGLRSDTRPRIAIPDTKVVYDPQRVMGSVRSNK